MDEHGKVRWCSQTFDLFEKDLDAYAWSDLETQFHTRKPCADTCTVGCVRKDSAPDEWRPQRLPAPPAPVRLRVV